MAKAVRETPPIGPLSPDWAEALMGWPIGWTDLDTDNADVYTAPGPVAGRSKPQHEWEPPRMVPAGSVANRTKRVRLIGNGIVLQVAQVAWARVLSTMLPRSTK